MAITIEDIFSSYQSGRAEFKAWEKDWTRRFYAPVGLLQLRVLFANLSPEQHEILKRDFPEQYEAVQNMIEGETLPEE